MAEVQFGTFYADWLRRHGLSHGQPAREAFAAAHPALFGRNVAIFHQGYDRYLVRRALPDTETTFARYCAPRWRLCGLVPSATARASRSARASVAASMIFPE